MPRKDERGALRREDYRKIKSMDRHEMENYIRRIYRRGYDRGLREAAEGVAPDGYIQTRQSAGNTAQATEDGGVTPESRESEEA